MKNIEVTFPMISDLTVDVSKAYGMLQPSVSTTQAVRAVFIIDPESKVRAMLYYPLTTGRNFQEIKRMVIAMQTSDKHGVATPADWQPGEEVIGPSHKSGVTSVVAVELARPVHLTTAPWRRTTGQKNANEMEIRPWRRN